MQGGAVRWHELSVHQQVMFGNGCGPAWLPSWLTLLLFGWFFEASCRRHDFAYSRGGDANDRQSADRGFLKAMMRDVKRLHWSVQLFAAIEALVFYALVRLFGWLQFDEGSYKSINEILK